MTSRNNWNIKGLLAAFGLIAFTFQPVLGQLQNMSLVNEPVDISDDVRCLKNTYYLARKLTGFDPATVSGRVVYDRYEYCLCAKSF